MPQMSQWIIFIGWSGVLGRGGEFVDSQPMQRSGFVVSMGRFYLGFKAS
jgi:hypothetical protein